MVIALALRKIVFSTGARCDTIYSYDEANMRVERVAHLRGGAGIVADGNLDEEQIRVSKKSCRSCSSQCIGPDSICKPRMCTDSKDQRIIIYPIICINFGQSRGPVGVPLDGSA
ncbi:Anthranilate synthase [Forsythia ovata]|uniref:Anthranilate synthase n=1 Tax=Forsythia ovata TaxID=205694 RepID=A0ABD1X120_9LAMI